MLTDAAIRKAKPGENAIRLFDGDGLYLEVSPAGGKWLGVRPDYIEHQLAHAVRDPNGRACNRTAHLSERRKMMQQWADYLDALRRGADVIPLQKMGA